MTHVFFLVKFLLLTRDTGIRILSIDPSVHHTPLSYGNGLTCHHPFLAYGSPIILLLPVTSVKFQQGHHTGALKTGGEHKFRYAGRREGNSYYGTVP